MAAAAIEETAEYPHAFQPTISINRSVNST